MIRSFIYDTLILRLTSRWYAEVLRRVPQGATLLDVGIGTAGALLANEDLVKRKGLRVVGIDIDADYIARARQRLRDSSLAGLAEVRLESVYEAARLHQAPLWRPLEVQGAQSCGGLYGGAGQ
jgi:2-polyprenyl-3-methyl-5-hydroxy-6-metoxy-1,4-benzoquinol methylase